MSIHKKPHPSQDLIDQFNELFKNYSIDDRGYRYLATALRLSVDVRWVRTPDLKAQMMGVLNLNPDWLHALEVDFKRYFYSKKLDIDDFDFIGESKFDRFICDSYIDEKIYLGYRNKLPGNRFSLGENLSGLKFIFANINYSIKEKIIFLYDAWDITSSAKAIDLGKLKDRLHESMQLTRGCKWFDAKLDSLSAAYDHLRREDPGCGYFFDSDELRIYFYKKYGASPESVELSIKKIQMLFNNRKSRATKNTKQVNFQLSDKSIKNVEKLSVKYGENKSKIVDFIFSNDKLLRRVDEFLNENVISRFGRNFDGFSEF